MNITEYINSIGGYSKIKNANDNKPNKASYFSIESKNYVFFGRNGEYNWWNGSEWKISYGTSYWDIQDRLIHLDGLPRKLLEYRRDNNIFEIQDHVFLRDEHYTELWLITNILDDGRIELKTAAHGYPVPTECWGMYYGMPEGLIHATDEQIQNRSRN